MTHIAPSLYLTPQPPNLSFFSEVTVAEVHKLIVNCKPKTSPLDYIPTHLLKGCADTFAPLICHLANLSFEQGRFPTSFKLAHITPLVKKPGLDEDDPSNLRPISNLNTISKLLEKLAWARIRPSVIENENFSSLQSGFRPAHSTETALVKVMNDALVAADSKQVTPLLSLDISAAFDALDHQKLLLRAETDFGISGSVLQWLSSYLSNRQSYVGLGTFKSSLTLCTSGVPQGSVLGPFLFSMFVSPIGKLIKNSGASYHQYADDTQIYTAIHPNTLQPFETIMHCVDLVVRWFLENGLLINPDKTDAIVLGSRQQISKLDLSSGLLVAGTQVSFSNKLKVLGVSLDPTLSMDAHVSEVVRGCNYHIRALRHIRPCLTDESARIIACGLIGARLDYCNSLLVGVTSRNIIRLQRVQNALARTVLRAPWRASSSTLLQTLHWLPVRQRIEFKIATLTYKVRSSKSPSYLADLLTEYTPSRTLRSTGHSLLFKPRANTAIASRAFQHSAPTIWNNLGDIYQSSLKVTSSLIHKKHSS